MPSINEITALEQTRLLTTLQTRFSHNPHRHVGIEWNDVLIRLQVNPGKLWSLYQMEETGGEPDVVGFDHDTGGFLFFDCVPESPVGRRSLCYDGAALAARKENKPRGSAMDMADAMGIELLSEAEYRQLQQFGPVDKKTSTWLKTPAPIRGLGGALFGDYRYGQVFIYHNGAESYYAARGFRGMLRV